MWVRRFGDVIALGCFLLGLAGLMLVGICCLGKQDVLGCAAVIVLGLLIGAGAGAMQRRIVRKSGQS